MKVGGREIKLVSQSPAKFMGQTGNLNLTNDSTCGLVTTSEMNITKSIKQNRCGAGARHQVVSTSWQAMRPASGIVSS